ncbi:MAG TPA: putative Ig domain-containing protein, partial [Desulfuromonadaceae bacterium]
MTITSDELEVSMGVQRLTQVLTFLATLFCFSIPAFSTSDWQPTAVSPNEPYSRRINALAIDPNNGSGQTIYAGTTSNGLFKSGDGGTTWSAANGSSGTTLTGKTINALVFGGDGYLYAGTTSSGVFCSTDGGATWATANGSDNILGTKTVKAFLVIGTDLYAGLSGGGGIYKSSNGGASWTSMVTGKDVNALARKNSTIFAGTAPNSGLFDVTDDENTWSWTTVGTGLPAATVNAVAVDTAGNLYAGMTSYGLWRYDVSTNTWGNITSGGLSATASVLALATSSNGTVYAGTSAGGLYKSTDNGASWIIANDGLPSTNNDVRSLAIDPTNNQTVYAGTGISTGNGVYKTTSGGVVPSPAITSPSSISFTVGITGTFTVRATGMPIPSISLSSGTLPTGVTFDSASGLLSGTPAAGTAGSYPLTFMASNGVSPDAQQSFTLTVRQSPAITSTASTTFTVGTAGSFTVTATGFPAPTFSATGTLPAGVSLNSNGTLSGTPASGSGGSYPITIRANNGSLATQSFILQVSELPTITSAAARQFAVGAEISFAFTAAGYPVPSVNMSGTLPTGVTFNPATGMLNGVPAVGSAGSYPITVTATNSAGSGSQTFTL